MHLNPVNDSRQLSFFKSSSNNQPQKELTQLNRRMIHILESISDSFFALDKNWNFVYVNKLAEELLAKKSEDLIGKNLWELFPEARISVNAEKVVESMKNGLPIQYEEYVREIHRYLDIRAKIVDETILIFLTDITERKRANELLVQSEERFKRMADSAPALIWMTGLKKKRHYFNQAWLEFRGHSLSQEIGNGWLEGVHTDDRDFCRDTFESAFEAKIDYQMEYRLQRLDGEYRWILEKGVPLYSNQGRFEGFIGSGIDITERKELEKRKDEFIGIASHELKTPLTSIKAFVQILSKKLSDSSDPQINRFLNKVNGHIDQLNGLITDLLDMSKVEQKKLQFNKVKFVLMDLVQDVIEDFEAIHTKIKFELVGDSKTTIFGDPSRISQVLVNFLANAVKYSPGSDKVVIKISEDDKSIEVSVQDFGIGISKSYQSQIFERFFRVPGIKKETFAGLGLGLYISSEIIKRHGGKVEVKSKRNQGSTFSFCLPKKGWEKS